MRLKGAAIRAPLQKDTVPAIMQHHLCKLHTPKGISKGWMTMSCRAEQVPGPHVKLHPHRLHHTQRLVSSARAHGTSNSKHSTRENLSRVRCTHKEAGSTKAEASQSKLVQQIPYTPEAFSNQVGVLVTTWRGRAASFTRESALLIYSALIDNTLVVFLEWLKVDTLLRKAQPFLESSIARLFGSSHQLKDGRKVPISLVNNTSPDFSFPQHAYQPAELPFGPAKSRGYDANIAHFMSLAMKVVYEEEEVIQDLCERSWGLNYHGYFSTPTEAVSLYDLENKNTADFIPRTRACMMSSQHGVVIAFRGSEPLNLINLRSSGKITMRPRFDMGRVHDGFHAALFHSDPEAGSLYTQLVECLQAVNAKNEKPIFLSGHSLGGALVIVMAAALHKKHPEIAARISGIYTFGMPRVGDAAFCQAMQKAYPKDVFRITHAADIIPLVPPQFLEYSHVGEEYYITSLGRIATGQKDIKQARRAETLAFIPLYLWKIVAGLALNPKEGSLRTLYRIVMLFTFPGLNDHFPADYSYKLEQSLQNTKKAKTEEGGNSQ